MAATCTHFQNDVGIFAKTLKNLGDGNFNIAESCKIQFY